MLHRLCGPPSIPLSFSLATVLPRWGAYRFRLAADCLPPTTSAHRLRRGLPGYLILFDPHAFVPSVNAGLASCLRYRRSVAYLRISPLHATFRRPRPHSSPPVSTALPGLGPGISPPTRQAACAPFKPNESGQRSHPPYYRCCWHGVSRRLFLRYQHAAFPTPPLSPNKRGSRPVGPHSLTRHGWFRVPPIDQYPLLLPPAGVWSVSQYQCGGPSSQIP